MDREEIFEDDRELLEFLRDYRDSSVPRPPAGFYDRAIARAVQEGHKQQRNLWVMTGFGGAIAAAVALWIVSGVYFTTPDIEAPALPSVTMAMEQPQTLNLVFSSATPLENATMTVYLPMGVEIDGFAGQREITWMTSLKEGGDIVELPLIAASPVGGEFRATLQHDDDDKTFRLQVTVI